MHPRGDVKLELAGETYTLRGTFGNLADFQAALDVVGLVPVLEMVGSLDARALMQGLACLGGVDLVKVRDLPFHECQTAVQEAILKAISGAMLVGDEDDVEGPEGNRKSEGK